MKGLAPPHFPETLDLSDIVTIIQQNIGGKPLDTVPGNSANGLYMIAPIGDLGTGTGMTVRFLKEITYVYRSFAPWWYCCRFKPV